MFNFSPFQVFHLLKKFAFRATHSYTCILQKQQNPSLTSHVTSSGQLSSEQLLGPDMLYRGTRPLFESINGGNLEIKKNDMLSLLI